MKIFNLTTLFYFLTGASFIECAPPASVTAQPATAATKSSIFFATLSKASMKVDHALKDQVQKLINLSSPVWTDHHPTPRSSWQNLHQDNKISKANYFSRKSMHAKPQIKGLQGL